MFDDTQRVISWLYYFHQQPKAFTGGELYVFDNQLNNRLYKNNSFTKINPVFNRLVAFPSCYYHAVAPTLVSSGKFEDGRMAIAGHIRFTD